MATRESQPCNLATRGGPARARCLIVANRGRAGRPFVGRSALLPADPPNCRELAPSARRLVLRGNPPSVSAVRLGTCPHTRARGSRSDGGTREAPGSAGVRGSLP
jgi:hypothetical protein